MELCTSANSWKRKKEMAHGTSRITSTAGAPSLPLRSLSILSDSVRPSNDHDSESNPVRDRSTPPQKDFSFLCRCLLPSPLPSRTIRYRASYPPTITSYSRHPARPSAGSGVHLLVLLDQRRRSKMREGKRAMNEWMKDIVTAPSDRQTGRTDRSWPVNRPESDNHAIGSFG